jgi:hypothetical protein
MADSEAAGSRPRLAADPAHGGHGPCTALHERRLRDIWRSAGWPCHDNIELDLLAAGLVGRSVDDSGRETLRVTDTGIARLAVKRRRHQAAMTAHESLVQRVALQQQRAGRVVWCGLTLRAPLVLCGQPDGQPQDLPAPGAQPALQPLPGLLEPAPPGADQAAEPAPAVQWALARPDVYAIRHTTVEAYVEPAAFEIKVSRADLLGDLRRPAKAAAYLALASQCWYVLNRGIAALDEIPAGFGVLWADEAGLEVARPAAVRPFRLPFAVWMALARAQPLSPSAEDGQAMI